MKNSIFILLTMLLFQCSTGSRQPENESSWEPLWNGKDLDGWNTYLSSPYAGMDKTQEDFLGLNNPEQDVITVVEQEREKVIRISGVSWGMMFTEKDYQNYHLKLKVKWGQEMHVPRENGPRDSGLLYHGFGGPGSAYVWMSSQELQIQEGDMGDYWPTGDVKVDVPVAKSDTNFYRYDENASLRTFYFAEILQENRMDSLEKRRVLKSFDNELPNGQWNEIELICFGDSSIHIVNGEVVMRLYNSRKMSDDSPLRSGQIIIQSEGAEVYYKDIEIKTINRLPGL